MLERIHLSGGRSIENSYAADGRKLYTEAKEGSQLEEGTKYYNGNLVLDKNKELEYIIFPEGRIIKDNTNFVYEYHLRDHLGSIRVAFSPTTNGKTVVQENAYYPFGATINDLSWQVSYSNKYGYNGKEKLDYYTGMQQYDYSARFYDPLTARWGVIDPLAEKYYGISPYVYCANNPIKYVDYRGDSISVAQEYREQMNSSLSSVFGDYSQNFSYTSTGMLTYNGSTEGMTGNQIAAMNGLNSAMTDEQITSVVYADTYDLTVGEKPKPVDIVKEYGGGVYSKTDNLIVIAPSVGTVSVTLDKLPFSAQDVQQNTTSALFHEIGERNTTRLDFRGGVIDYENYARRVIRLPVRPYDLNHSKTIKTVYK